jgi:hypothetical protein
MILDLVTDARTVVNMRNDFKQEVGRHEGGFDLGEVGFTMLVPDGPDRDLKRALV